MVKTPTSTSSAKTRGDEASTSGKERQKRVQPEQRKQRILGIDIARGLAIIGMIYLHLGHPLWQTKVLLSGLPAALFAVIAGVTMMLIWTNAMRRAKQAGQAAQSAQAGKAGEAGKAGKSGAGENANARAATTSAITATIAKLLARGGIITLIGLVLLPVGGQIQVVLVVLGVSMLATAWIPPLPTTAKVALLLIAAAASTWKYASLTLPLPYPHLAWIAYVIAGMILFEVYVGKDGNGAGGVIKKATTIVSLVLALGGLYLRFQTELPGWARATGHTGVLGEIVLSIAVAAIVLHLCLLLGRHVRATNPLVTMGSMALTVYILHVLTAWWWQNNVSLHSDLWALVFIVVFLVFAWVWKKIAGRGPAKKLFAGQGPAERCVAQAVRVISGERA